ncbi:hypothetical protein M885DRAFT_571284 [Pelagophyceae sp. CCMP2097]|nr:hypothetical protein M885DRAFT_571284 [Pelagophyceae sp. CCMP2097]
MLEPIILPSELALVEHGLKLTPGNLNEMFAAYGKDPEVTANTGTSRMKHAKPASNLHPRFDALQEKSAILKSVGQCDAKGGLCPNTLAKFVIKPLADLSKGTQQFVILINGVFYFIVFKSHLALYNMTLQVSVGFVDPNCKNSALAPIFDYWKSGNFRGIDDSPVITQDEFVQERCLILETIRGRSAELKRAKNAPAHEAADEKKQKREAAAELKRAKSFLL